MTVRTAEELQGFYDRLDEHIDARYVAMWNEQGRPVSIRGDGYHVDHRPPLGETREQWLARVELRIALALAGGI